MPRVSELQSSKRFCWKEVMLEQEATILVIHGMVGVFASVSRKVGAKSNPDVGLEPIAQWLNGTSSD